MFTKLIKGIRKLSAKILSSLRKGRKSRLIVIVAIIAIIAPLAVNTLLNMNANQVRADSFFKFDEGYGTSSAVHDSNGTVSAGSITNAVWKADDLCYSGKCIFFDGTGDYINMGNNYNFVAADNFTISFWMRHTPKTSGTDVIIAKTNASAGYKIQMESDGDITFAIDDDATWTPDASITSTAATYDDNKWHYISAVKTGTTKIELYIDSILVASNSNISSVGSLSNSNNFYIGVDGNGSSNYFTGFIDELKIYTSTARTSDQVKSDYAGTPISSGTSASFGPDQSYLSDGLIGYWKMDEASGSATLADSSGNGNPATWSTGGSHNPGGKFGNGGAFDGANDYAYAPLSASSVNEFTMSIWFNSDVLQYGEMMVWSPNDVSGANFAAINIRSSPLKLNFYSDWTNHVQYTITTGKWYMATMTLDANNLWRFYVNGELIGTYQDDATHSNQSTSDYIVFGREYLGYFDGKLDEGRVYNRALSPSEVQSLYNWAPGPVGYWKMDENTGTNAYDSSGNGLTGSFFGSQKWSSDCKFGSCFRTYDNTGVLDVMHTDDNDLLDFSNTQDYTLSMWTKFISKEASSTPILDKGAAGGNKGYNIMVYTSNNFSCAYNDGAGNWDVAPAPANSATDGKWHHLECVMDRDGSEMGAAGIYFYLDGIRVGSNNVLIAGDGSGSTQGLYIGEAGSSGYENSGLYDDVKVYRYARNPAQIIEDMNAGHPAPGSPVGSAVGEWRFDEGYGDTAYNAGSGGTTINGDLAGSGTTCPTTGSCPTWTNEGKYGKALNFDGSDDYVQVAANSGINGYGKTGLTVSAWVYANSLGGGGYGRIVDKRNSTTDSSGVGYNLYLITDESGNAQLYSAVGCTTQNAQSHSGNIITFGSWHHVVMVFNPYGNNEIYHYIDGIQAREKGDKTECTGTLADDTAVNMRIGNYAGSTARAFNGLIDDVRIFDSALTSDQIKLLYNQGSAASMGVLSTASSSATMTSTARSYCPPGDTGTCNPPVGEWNLDENTGATAYDTSGYNRSGTLTNAKWQAGKFGSGLLFNGNGNVSISDNDAFSVTTTNKLTFEGWFRIDTLGVTQFPISKRASSSNYEWHMRVNTSNALSCYVTQLDGTTYMSAAPTDVIYTAPGQWHHLACVVDTSAPSISVYADGRFLGSSSATAGSIGNGTAPVQIGEDGAGGNDMYGVADNVRIYNYTRTPAQIAWDYNQGKPYAWWRFDEGSGDTANNASEVGSSINGDLAGSGGSCPGASSCPTWTTGKLNGALSYDNSNDYVAIPALTSLSSLTDFSVSAWYNSNGSNDTILEVHDGSATATADELRLRRDSTLTIEVKTNNSVRTNTITVTSNGTWHHIMVTRSGTTLNAYLDGKLESSVRDSSGALNLSNCNLLIGTDNDTANCSSITPTNVFDGKIDDVKIWNYALTPLQVQTEFNNGSAVYFH